MRKARRPLQSRERSYLDLSRGSLEQDTDLNEVLEKRTPISVSVTHTSRVETNTTDPAGVAEIPVFATISLQEHTHTHVYIRYIFLSIRPHTAHTAPLFIILH